MADALKITNLCKTYIINKFYIMGGIKDINRS